ncbi:MAG: sulfotransferase [Planctomycetaceae bacterium]|nr:sulfotransferase [Planctomycetaceae bacterium]
MPFDLNVFCRVLWLGTLGGERFHWKRAFATIVGCGIVAALALARTIGWGMDLLIFPRLKKQKVESPIFIIGTPRSGTTLLHRLISECHPNAVTTPLWQTLFPSLTQQRIIRGVDTFDRVCLKGWFRRYLVKFENALFRGWEGIHSTGFEAIEECEAVWLLAMSSPAIYLLVPYIDKLPEIQFLDHESGRRKQTLTKYYRGFLQRQMYGTRRGQFYLGKNVFFLGRLAALMEEFPDARFVHVVRDPAQSIPSSVSMFTKPWNIHSPDLVHDKKHYRQMAEIFCHDDRHLVDIYDQFPGRILTVQYHDLIQSPRDVVCDISEKLGIGISPDSIPSLERQDKEQQHYTSKHRYSLEEFGLDSDWLDQQVAEFRRRFNLQG